MAFDYRVNRGRAGDLLTRAAEFNDTAREAVAADRPAVAVECFYAAAELAITAMMVLGGPDNAPRRSSHGHRLSWLNQFTRLGNAPRDFHHVVKSLARWRPSARYLDIPAVDGAASDNGTLAVDEVAAAGEDVGALLEHARARCGPISATG